MTTSSEVLPAQLPKEEAEEEEEVFNVLKIHERSVEGGIAFFLVEWEGYPKQEEWTWEPEEHLVECSIYQDFVRQDFVRQDFVRQDFVRQKKRSRNGRASPASSSSSTPTPVDQPDGRIIRVSAIQRRPIQERERIEIAGRQGMRCNICLDHLFTIHSILTVEIDHIIPLELNGPDGNENLQALCPQCHLFKTTNLDKGLIARVVQASAGRTIDTLEIITQSRLMFACRNRDRPPHGNTEILDFVSSVSHLLTGLTKPTNVVESSPTLNIIQMVRSSLALGGRDVHIQLTSSDITICLKEPENINPNKPEFEAFINNFLKDTIGCGRITRRFGGLSITCRSTSVDDTKSVDE